MNLTLDSFLSADFTQSRKWLAAKYAVLDEVLAGRRPAILYPSARMARQAATRLRQMGVQVLGYGDSNSKLWGTSVDGLAVYSPDEIGARYRDVPILLASTLYDSAITELLTSMGCTKVIPVGYLNLVLPTVFVSREYQGAFEAVTNQANHPAIRWIHELLADDESRRVFVAKLFYSLTLEKQLLDGVRSRRPIYFDRDIFRLGSDEVVVDAGAYTGDTFKQFVHECGDKYRAYYAFEPDEANFLRLKSSVDTARPRVITVQAGLAKQSGQLRFLSTACGDAKIVPKEESGAMLIQVLSLDEFFADKPAPTLVKMDIESAESDALNGAQGLIAEQNPKLAISAYHHASDLWEIPALIHKLNLRYRLYIRHYTREIDDTVCYALPN
jgi:FkbM family methyltransferase